MAVEGVEVEGIDGIDGAGIDDVGEVMAFRKPYGLYICIGFGFVQVELDMGLVGADQSAVVEYFEVSADVMWGWISDAGGL